MSDQVLIVIPKRHYHSALVYITTHIEKASLLQICNMFATDVNNRSVYETATKMLFVHYVT